MNINQNIPPEHVEKSFSLVGLRILPTSGQFGATLATSWPDLVKHCPICVSCLAQIGQFCTTLTNMTQTTPLGVFWTYFGDNFGALVRRPAFDQQFANFGQHWPNIGDMVAQSCPIIDQCLTKPVFGRNWRTVLNNYSRK